MFCGDVLLALFCAPVASTAFVLFLIQSELEPHNGAELSLFRSAQQMMGVTSDAEAAQQMVKVGGQFVFRAERRGFLRRCLDGNYAGATIRTCVYKEDDLGELRVDSMKRFLEAITLFRQRTLKSGLPLK